MTRASSIVTVRMSMLMPVDLTLGPNVFDRNVLTLDAAAVLQAGMPMCGEPIDGIAGRCC